MGDTVEELKRYNARRKLKGAVQSVTNGIMSLDADTNSSILIPICYFFGNNFFYLNILVAVGSASDSLNDWADEEAGLEAVQTVLDSLDDIHALQDSYVDNDLLKDMLRDIRLHELLRVSSKFINQELKFLILFIYF